MKSLVDACNEALYQEYGKIDGIKKRQVYDDIKFMESKHGYDIELEKNKIGKRVYYRYTDRKFSINQRPLNPLETSQIQEVLFILSRFRGMPQFEWMDDIFEKLKGLSKGGISGEDKIIDFEQNLFPNGLAHITALFNAIYNRRVLRIEYQPFSVNVPITHTFHPYFLKQYNLRWFAFGWSNEANQIANLALDRIVSVSETDKIFVVNNTIDFNEYFDDIVGVTFPKDGKVEKVKLFVTDKRWPYIETKPLHGSQKKPQPALGGVTIEITVIINNELVQRILSFGQDIKILSPAHLQDKVKSIVTESLNNYL